MPAGTEDLAGINYMLIICSACYGATFPPLPYMLLKLHESKREQRLH